MELKDYEINQDLRFYYQRKLLKLIRDFDMFADDKDKKEQFEQINENFNELSEQKKFMEILESIGLGSELDYLVNYHVGQKQNVLLLNKAVEESSKFLEPESSN